MTSFKLLFEFDIKLRCLYRQSSLPALAPKMGWRLCRWPGLCLWPLTLQQNRNVRASYTAKRGLTCSTHHSPQSRQEPYECAAAMGRWYPCQARAIMQVRELMLAFLSERQGLTTTNFSWHHSRVIFVSQPVTQETRLPLAKT